MTKKRDSRSGESTGNQFSVESIRTPWQMTDEELRLLLKERMTAEQIEDYLKWVREKRAEQEEWYLVRGAAGPRKVTRIRAKGERGAPRKRKPKTPPQRRKRAT